MPKLVPGVYCAALTPLNSDLTIDSLRLVAHCEAMFSNGAHGILLFGTTGEGNSFSLAEKANLLKTFSSSKLPLDRILVSTGSCAHTDVLDLNRYCHEYGFSNFLIMPPFYYQNISVDALRKWFSSVIHPIGNKESHIYLYHFPKMSGIDMDLNTISLLKKDHPEHLAGIKDSSGNFAGMEEQIKGLKEFDVFAGTEKLLTEVLQAGGQGCISATSNITIKHIQSTYEAHQSGLDVEDLDTQLKSIRGAIDGMPFVGTLKAFLANYSSSNTWQFIRPPNSLYSTEGIVKLHERLNELGWIKPEGI